MPHWSRKRYENPSPCKVRVSPVFLLQDKRDLRGGGSRASKGLLNRQSISQGPVSESEYRSLCMCFAIFLLFFTSSPKKLRRIDLSWLNLECIEIHAKIGPLQITSCMFTCINKPFRTESFHRFILLQYFNVEYRMFCTILWLIKT